MAQSHCLAHNPRNNRGFPVARADWSPTLAVFTADFNSSEVDAKLVDAWTVWNEADVISTWFAWSDVCWNESPVEWHVDGQSAFTSNACVNCCQATTPVISPTKLYRVTQKWGQFLIAHVFKTLKSISVNWKTANLFVCLFICLFCLLIAGLL